MGKIREFFRADLYECGMVSITTKNIANGHVTLDFTTCLVGGIKDSYGYNALGLIVILPLLIPINVVYTTTYLSVESCKSIGKLSSKGCKSIEKKYIKHKRKRMDYQRRRILNSMVDEQELTNIIISYMD